MIRPKQAKKILPKSELEQFEAIIDNQTSRLSDARLRQKADISRRLRDKYRRLARHQSVMAKQKLTNETDVSQNETRAEIFQALLERIELELSRPNRGRSSDASISVPLKRMKRSRQELLDEVDNDTARELADAKRRELA